jgi:hypothetical protein
MVALTPTPVESSCAQKLSRNSDISCTKQKNASASACSCGAFPAGVGAFSVAPQPPPLALLVGTCSAGTIQAPTHKSRQSSLCCPEQVTVVGAQCILLCGCHLCSMRGAFAAPKCWSDSGLLRSQRCGTWPGYGAGAGGAGRSCVRRWSGTVATCFDVLRDGRIAGGKSRPARTNAPPAPHPGRWRTRRTAARTARSSPAAQRSVHGPRVCSASDSRVCISARVCFVQLQRVCAALD